MINPHAIAVCGVGYKPLTLATDGFVYSKTKKKKIPVYLPFQDLGDRVGGWRGGAIGSSSYGILNFDLFRDRPKSNECLDWSKCIFDEIQRTVYREKFLGYLSGTDVIERISHRWICTDEALLIAAQAAVSGRLEPTVRSWSVKELIESGGPEDDQGKIRSLFDSVRHSMYFVANPVGAQWISGADVTTDDGTGKAEMPAGSCIDYSIKLASSLLSVGIRVALVGQSTRRDGQLDHVAVAAWDGTLWVRLDPSEKKFNVGDSKPSTREVWVHLPEMEIAHNGPPPDHIRIPEVRNGDQFQVVGLGRLGWSGNSSPAMAPRSSHYPSRTVRSSSLGQAVSGPAFPVVATIFTMSLLLLAVYAVVKK